MPDMPKRYFIRWLGCKWEEVDKEHFVNAERAAGFVNTMGQPAKPATAGFTGPYGSKGCIIYPGITQPSHYDWDPEFRDVAWPKVECD